jgi:hypothetical protein
VALCRIGYFDGYLVPPQVEMESERSPFHAEPGQPLLGPADCSSSRSHSTDNRSAIQQPPEAPRRAIRGICTTLPGSRCASRAVALGGRSARPNATSAPLRHRGLSVATEAALEAKESKQPGYRCGLPTRILPTRNAHFAEALKREDLCEGLSEAKARGLAIWVHVHKNFWFDFDSLFSVCR